MQTITQLIERLERNIERIKQEEIPFIIAVKDTIGKMAERIFEDNLDSTGSKMPEYSTRELWVSDENLPRKGTNIGKTGKKIKTSYYENYKALKKQQGFSGERDLKLTGRLLSEFINKPVDAKGRFNGDVGDPIMIGEMEAAIKVSKRSAAIINQYPTVFKLSKEEKENFINVLTFEIKKALFND